MATEGRKLVHNSYASMQAVEELGASQPGTIRRIARTTVFQVSLATPADWGDQGDCG